MANGDRLLRRVEEGAEELKAEDELLTGGRPGVHKGGGGSGASSRVNASGRTACWSWVVFVGF